MKKITLLNSIIIAITSIFFQINSNAQTLVNREWVTTGGNPNEHFEYVSGSTANGFFYIIGSTYRSTQQDNFYIAKIESDGTIHWIKEFNSLTDYRDFGIDIVAKDTLIYVTGMSWDSISGTSKIVTLRLDDNNGNIVWSQNWGSRYNVPVKITADNNGNVYVGGTAETSASEFAMVVLKYSPSGSLDWASTYDSIGVIDGAVALVLDSPQNYLTITGYSGNGFNNWDFTTVQMDVSTGNIKNTTITQNGNGGFNKPVGISGDGTTTYIGGTVTHPTTGKKRMKIIGYDYQWQEVNLSYYGDSLTETEAVDMHNDFTGANVLLATHTRTDGHKEIIVARYALSDGSLLWDRTLSAPSGEDAEAGSFTIAGDANNIYLTGSIKSSSGRHRMLTAAYDLDGNLMWMKEYNRTATSDDRGKTVDADVDGNPVTTGVSTDIDTTTYMSVKYSQWSPSNACHISRSDCPSISYDFKNGKISTFGLDSFVEFDIYAKQSIDSLPYKGGNIILTYSNIAFGDSITDNSNIVISRGDITIDSNYLFTLYDTLFNSSILDSSSSEILLKISTKNDTDLYIPSDTFQQLCHIKIKLKERCRLGIYFDQFFMEDKSQYFSSSKIDYNYVYTGKAMSLMSTTSSATIYYNLTNVAVNVGGGINGAGGQFAFDILAKTDISVDLANALAQVNYDNLSIEDNPKLYYPNWVPAAGYTNNIYEGVFTHPPSRSGFSVQEDLSNNPNHIGLHRLGFSYERFISMEFITKDCTVLPEMALSQSFMNGFMNDYYDIDGILTDFNVNVEGGYNQCYCPGKTNEGSCFVGINQNLDSYNPITKIYPIPFNNNIIININLLENSNVEFNIENVLSQTIVKSYYNNLPAGIHNEVLSLPENISSVQNPVKLTTLDRFKLTTPDRLKLTISDRSKLTT